MGLSAPMMKVTLPPTRVILRQFISMHALDPRPIYTIDACDRLVEANRAFAASLRAHQATPLDPHALIGRSIWSLVPRGVTRHLLKVLYDRVRAVGAPLFIALRADSADTRRVVDLELHPLGERSIRHVRECVSTEPRPAVALLDPNYPRDARTLLRCAWCARIQVRLGMWQEIEEAQASLQLEATETLPAVREGACAACTQSVLKTYPARVA